NVPRRPPPPPQGPPPPHPISPPNPPPHPNPPAPGRPPTPQVVIPPEAAETADELFARLRRLCAEGRVAIELDNKRLMHIDSPVSFEAWGNQLIYPLLGLTIGAWWWLGWEVGAAPAVGSGLLYLALGEAVLYRALGPR